VYPVPGSLEIAPHDAKARLDAGEVQVVDVREPAEWEVGRIPNPAVRHIPLGSLQQEAATIDRERPVVFQCRVGARSLMAAQAFRNAGYEAYSLTGGLIAWQAAGLPLDGGVA